MDERPRNRRRFLLSRRTHQTDTLPHGHPLASVGPAGVQLSSTRRPPPRKRPKHPRRRRTRFRRRHILDIMDAPAAPSARISPNQKWLVITERDLDFTPLAELAEPQLTVAGVRQKLHPDTRIDNLGIKRLTLRSLDGAIERDPCSRRRAAASGRGRPCAIQPPAASWPTRVVHKGAMSVRLYDATTGIDRARLDAGPQGQDRRADVHARRKAPRVQRRAPRRRHLVDRRHPPRRRSRGEGDQDQPHQRRLRLDARPPAAGGPGRRRRPRRPAGGERGPGRADRPGVLRPHRRGRARSRTSASRRTTRPCSSTTTPTRSRWSTSAGKVTRLGAPGLHQGAAPSPDGRYLLVAHPAPAVLVPGADVPIPAPHRGVGPHRQAGEADRRRAPAREPAERPRRHHARHPRHLLAHRRPRDAAAGGGARRRRSRARRCRSAIASPCGPRPSPGSASPSSRPSCASAASPGPSRSSPSCTSTRSGPRRPGPGWSTPPTPTAAPRLLWDCNSEDRYSHPGSLVYTEHPTEYRQVPLRSADGRWVYLQGAGAAPDGGRPVPRPARSRHVEDRAALAVRAPALREPPRGARSRGGAHRVHARIADRTPESLPARAGRRRQPAPAAAHRSARPGAVVREGQGRADQVQARGRHPAQRHALPAARLRQDPRRPPALRVLGLPARVPDRATARTRSAGRRWSSGARRAAITSCCWRTATACSTTPPCRSWARPARSRTTSTCRSSWPARRPPSIEVVHLGVADRDRIAIGGHSYGAFMTANLLAHTDLFRAGIARSGAYNRTLTPFGFQAEPRTYWQAPDIYHAMSPFTHVPKIKEPILLIHGMRDSNSGTFPVQTERLFAALKGDGRQRPLRAAAAGGSRLRRAGVAAARALGDGHLARRAREEREAGGPGGGDGEALGWRSEQPYGRRGPLEGGAVTGLSVAGPLTGKGVKGMQREQPPSRSGSQQLWPEGQGGGGGWFGRAAVDVLVARRRRTPCSGCRPRGRSRRGCRCRGGPRRAAEGAVVDAAAAAS